MQTWFAARCDGGFPVLVAERPDHPGIAGYASFGPFRQGEGYAGTVEHSVYVDTAHRGHGVASALMHALIGRARSASNRLMIGGISADAEPSLRLHARLGFREVGRIPGAGHKFGRTRDLVLMALPLDSGRDA